MKRLRLKTIALQKSIRGFETTLKTHEDTVNLLRQEVVFLKERIASLEKNTLKKDATEKRLKKLEAFKTEMESIDQMFDQSTIEVLKNFSVEERTINQRLDSLDNKQGEVYNTLNCKIDEQGARLDGRMRDLECDLRVKFSAECEHFEKKKDIIAESIRAELRSEKGLFRKPTDSQLEKPIDARTFCFLVQKTYNNYPN